MTVVLLPTLAVTQQKYPSSSHWTSLTTDKKGNAALQREYCLVPKCRVLQFYTPHNEFYLLESQSSKTLLLVLPATNLVSNLQQATPPWILPHQCSQQAP